MNRGILWLFILLALIGSVNAVNINLLFPNQPSHSSTTNRIDFRCGASDTSSSIYELTLYTDISGVWQKTGTSCTYMPAVNQANCTFIVTNIPAGTYKYNCNVNNEQNKWAPSNFTFTFSLINDPPIFNGTIPSQTWSKNTVLNNIFNLNNYFSDPIDTLTYTTSGNNKITIDIVNGVVTLTPFLNWVGSEIVIFTANDGKGGTANSNNVVLTVSESGSPPTLSCTGTTITWYKDNNKNINLHDYCDPDATSYSIVEYPTNIGVSLSSNSVTFTPNSSWTGTQTAKFNAVKDSLNSNFTFTLTVQEQSSSDDEEEEEEETTATNEDEFDEDEETSVFTIESHSPTSSKASIKVGESKKFEVTPSGDAETKWYLDDTEVYEGNSYTFKSNTDGLFEITAVIGSDPTLRENDDFYMWTVTVGELANLCGNDKIDAGENCENCAKDVKCGDGEECINKTCAKTSKNFFLGLSGYAVKGKDFVIKKWKYSSIIGGAIVVLIVVGLLYAGKRRKKDVLYSFGKESFFGRIGRLFKKKSYIAPAGKPVIEKQTEVYIDKKSFSDNEQL